MRYILNEFWATKPAPIKPIAESTRTPTVNRLRKDQLRSGDFISTWAASVAGIRHREPYE